MDALYIVGMEIAGATPSLHTKYSHHSRVDESRPFLEQHQVSLKIASGHIICYRITCWLGRGGASFRGRRDSLGFRVSMGDCHWMVRGEIGER